MTTQQDEREELIRKLNFAADNNLMLPSAYAEAFRKAAALLAADGQAGGEAVARVVRDGSTVRPEWTSADAAHNAKPGDLYTHPRPQAVAQGRKLWLWKNFVGGKPEYWAFDNPYPTRMDCGDPQTIGEPCGYAIFKPSRCGRVQWTEESVMLGILNASPADPAAQVAQPLTDEQWLKKWTHETGERLKPGVKRDRLLWLFKFAERAAHGIGKDQAS